MATAKTILFLLFAAAVSSVALGRPQEGSAPGEDIKQPGEKQDLTAANSYGLGYGYGFGYPYGYYGLYGLGYGYPYYSYYGAYGYPFYG